MTLTIKARELGDEHLGAKIRTTMAGWTIEGYLEEVRGTSSDYYLGLREKFSRGTAAILRDADVTILEEAPIRHPDEPTGLGAVVEADTGERKPVRWICSSDSGLGLRWLRPDGGIGEWYTWLEIQGEAIASIRVLSEGVHLSEDEPETLEVSESGMGTFNVKSVVHDGSEDLALYPADREEFLTFLENARPEVERTVRTAEQTLEQAQRAAEKFQDVLGWAESDSDRPVLEER